MARPPYTGDTTICPRCDREHGWFDRKRNGRVCEQCVSERCRKSDHRNWRKYYDAKRELTRPEREEKARKRAQFMTPGTMRKCNSGPHEKLFPDEFCKGKNHRMCKDCFNALAKRCYASNIEWRRLQAVTHAASHRVRKRAAIANSPKEKRLTWRVTPRFILSLLDQQNSRCANLACRSDIREEYEVDHIMPIILGGLHSADNIQLLCQSCNRSKAGKHPDAWRAELGVLF